MKKVILIIFVSMVITVIQYGLFAVIWDAIIYGYGFVKPIPEDLYWGRTFWISIRYIIIPTLLISNLLLWIRRLKCKMILYSILHISVLIYWLDIARSYPYRACAVWLAFISVCGLGTFAIHKFQSCRND